MAGRDLGIEHEGMNRDMASGVGLDASTAVAPKLGAHLAEEGAKMKGVTQPTGEIMGVTFITPDGKEVTLTGTAAFLAGIIGGWAGWRKK